MSRTRLERETTITFNEAEGDAIVWSASPVFQRRMEKRGHRFTRQQSGGRWYKVKKTLVSIRSDKRSQAGPRKGRFLLPGHGKNEVLATSDASDGERDTPPSNPTGALR